MPATKWWHSNFRMKHYRCVMLLVCSTWTRCSSGTVRRGTSITPCRCPCTPSSTAHGSCLFCSAAATTRCNKRLTTANSDSSYRKWSFCLVCTSPYRFIQASCVCGCEIFSPGFQLLSPRCGTPCPELYNVVLLQGAWETRSRR